ncbi:VWA domain-containing protein [Halobacteriovorax sp. ZH4_bin.1]|uniref:VWA domain-containing protein n=1 Tax=unclassified Halobacteriovorax TaxID=2639665 RepID=UPI003716D30E
MDFVNTKLLIISIVAVAIFISLLYLLRKRFFKIVKQVWNFNSRPVSKMSMLCYTLAFFGFALSLGDLRGPEELVESNIPNQRTLILIDNSLSMLVEDIRPNRISKAAIIAKHFVKNAYGHQVALSIFSDIQRKIVPFTDDVDILESRLGTMLSAAPEGGSNVSLALKEAFQFFKTSDGFTKGNILLITDGEEHSNVEVDIPNEISLAIVGVGTEEGGKIPMRGKRGNFFGYKKFNGVEIISKLNKHFFENLVKKSKYAKVWFVESYSLPTQEILGFFKDIHLNSFTKGTLRSRPVLGYWLIVTSIIFYILSVFFGRFKTFKPITMLILISLFIVPSGNNYAQEEVEVDPMQEMLVDKMRAGNISKAEKLKLAELFLKQKDGQKQAADIYNETLNNYEDEEPTDLFNYATALLKNNQFVDSVNLYKYILEQNADNEDLSNAIKKQIKFALQKQKQDKKKQEQDKKKQEENKDNKENKENKDNKDNKKQDQQQQKKDGKQEKDGKQDQGQKGQEDNKKDQKKSDKGNEKKDQSQSENENDKDDKNKKKQKTQQQQWKDLEDQAKKKKRMRKANGVFKQIMNDDSQLQKKFIDTTSDGNNNRKDW